MIGKGALILVVGFGIICGIIGARMSNLQTEAVGNMSYYHDVTNSHTIASAGANAAVSMIYQDPSKRGHLTSQSFTTGTLKGGSVTARMDSLADGRLRMRSVSQYTKYSDTIEVYFSTQKLNSFSMFAWMTNHENGVWWITADTVWGRVHSNGVLNVNGKPTFFEKVTTAKKFNPKPGTGTNKGNYKKGYETGVAHIKFPNDLTELSSAASAGGRNYTQDIWVTLSGGTASSGDGKAYVRYSSTGPIVDSVAISDGVFNGAMWTTKKAYVQGVLDGRLSIGAADDIVVVDDVKYELDPYAYSTTDDMLGLIAEDDIIVADNAANNSNCEIHASIFSRTSSFTAQNYNTRPVAGWLKIIGGIIQDVRGPVGTFSGSTINHGFSKRYYYDPRLANPQVRPPYFPGFFTQTLTITNWWENVRIPQYF